MCDDECTCREKYSSELGRLEVLTDLIEFAEQQMAKGSPYTAGWADSVTTTKWMETIGNLRTVIPKCAVENFDDFRKRKRDFIKQINRRNDGIL